MNWNIGERINREILGNMRAEYGKRIVSRLATQLRELPAKDVLKKYIAQQKSIAEKRMENKDDKLDDD